MALYIISLYINDMCTLVSRPSILCIYMYIYYVYFFMYIAYLYMYIHVEMLGTKAIWGV